MNSEIEPFYLALGRTIRERRKRGGPSGRLTQADLAKQLDPPLTRAAIANIESGKQRVLAHTLWQIASLLGASPIDLMPSDGIPGDTKQLRAVKIELGEKLAMAPERASNLARKAAVAIGARKPERRS